MAHMRHAHFFLNLLFLIETWFEEVQLTQSW
jgi:hypothetical protein